MLQVVLSRHTHVSQRTHVGYSQSAEGSEVLLVL
jgi:hypothetical protein